jgi:NADH-quinone oxidoreductase subunit M
MRSAWLAVPALISVVITAAYLLRMLSRILFGEPSHAVASLSDPRPVRFAPMAILAALIMVVGILPASLYNTILVGVMPIAKKLAGG